MKTYTTSEAAQIIGVHPNTVRLYEVWGLIPQAERRPNGYRIFTEFHIAQLRLARAAFRVEVLQNGLRKKAVETVKLSAKGAFDQALASAGEYRNRIRKEKRNAEEAVGIARQYLSAKAAEHTRLMTRREVSDSLEISMDTLRNWERNGLLQIKREQNGYRAYTEGDLQRLKIIRVLRLTNYSLEAILRMLHALEQNPHANLEQALNTPQADADIVSVCDRLSVSLQDAEHNACRMICMLEEMKTKFSNPPL